MGGSAGVSHLVSTHSPYRRPLVGGVCTVFSYLHGLLHSCITFTTACIANGIVKGKHSCRRRAVSMNIL